MSYPHNPTLILLLVILLAVVTWGHEPAARQESSDVGESLKTSKPTDGRPAVISAPAVAAAPIQGVTGKGSAFVLYRSEIGLVREFVVKFTGERG